VRTGNCVGVSFPKAPLGMQPESVTETGVAEIFLVNLHGSLFFLNECWRAWQCARTWEYL
jgi:hypothetical protein